MSKIKIRYQWPIDKPLDRLKNWYRWSICDPLDRRFGRFIDTDTLMVLLGTAAVFGTFLWVLRCAPKP